ncbi:MAG TPA: tryptophan--tRNA ligase, partial [Gemmatimonadales bacterium]|nr:tryptophan--tRNA ligase [Gemmatimonadales bacterium]
NPDICNIFTLHQGFSSAPVQQDVAQKCRSAGWGCLDCKRVLADNMIAALAPIRERAAELRAHPDRVREMLSAGAHKAQKIAAKTLADVRSAMGFMPPGA